jgi:hypothetical protein
MKGSAEGIAFYYLQLGQDLSAEVARHIGVRRAGIRLERLIPFTSEAMMREKILQLIAMLPWWRRLLILAEHRRLILPYIGRVKRADPGLTPPYVPEDELLRKRGEG